MRANLSFKIRGQVDPEPVDPVDFRMLEVVDPWRTRDYLFAKNGTGAVRFTSSNENVAKVTLLDGVWALDYRGSGVSTITCTRGTETVTKVITVRDPAKGRVVNAGTGSGDLIISRANLSLLDGDTVVIKAGQYHSLTIRDIVVAPGNPRIEIVTDGYVGISDSFSCINIRRVIVDGSRAFGFKHGIGLVDSPGNNKAFLQDINDNIFRNIKFVNTSYWSLDVKDLIYNGSESSYYKNNQFVNILCDNAGGFSAGAGGINLTDYGIKGLCVDFKFIGWEFINTSPGYGMYLPAAQGVSFDQFTVDNVNANDNKHNGIFFVGGHADVTRSKFVNHQGNAIRLWPFTIVDGNLSNGTALRTAKFTNNIIFRSRVYSAFEIQGFEAHYQEGLTKGVHLVVANNTAGHLGLSDPTFFVAKLVDRYGNGVEGEFYAYNNILAKTMGAGGGFFQYLPTTEQTLTENRLYADYEEAKFDPASFTLDTTSTAWGAGIRNEFTNDITEDFYGNPIGETFSMGAVQQDHYSLPAVIEKPTTPDVSVLFNELGDPGNIRPDLVIASIHKSYSGLGIKNYDIEVNGTIYTTAAGYPRIGKQANYSHPNVPFTEYGKEYAIRFRARDFRDQVSDWSGIYKFRTITGQVDAFDDLTLTKTSGGTLIQDGRVYSQSGDTVYAYCGTIPAGKSGRITFIGESNVGVLGYALETSITSLSQIKAGMGTYNDQYSYTIDDGFLDYAKEWQGVQISIFFNYSGETIFQKSYDGGITWENYRMLSDKVVTDKHIHCILKAGDHINDPGIIIYDSEIAPDPEPEPEPEARLTFDPEDVFASNLNTQFDEGEKFIHQRSLDKLADQSYIVDVNNAPTGLPADGPVVHVNGYGSYSPSWYNMGGFFEFTIDLRSVCEITKIFMVLNSHSSSPLRVWGSLDGINKTLLLDSPNMPIGNGAWYPLPVDISEATNVRYLSFGVAHGELGLNGIAIYGKRKTPKVGLGFKSTRSVPLRKFTDTLGTNAFLEENDYDMIANTSTFVRYYNDSGWLVSSWANETLLPEQITLFPKTSHMWDFDAKMQSAIAHGHKILFCYKKSPDHLGQLVGRENSEAKPTDPGLNARDFSVTTDPMSYTHIARIAFLFAARYGKNSNIDSVYDSQYSDPNPPYGLNLFEYFELGNEPDGHWKGQDAVTMPQELAAMYSAVYDGHKGALGAGFGIKAADPAMKFVNGGFAGFRPGWFKEMCLWWDANRGPGDYPIQVMNIHCYNSYEEEYNTPMYSPIPAYGVPPEQGTYLPEMKKLSDFRDKVMPTAELWVTETGYDEQYGGMYAPNDRDQTPRSRHKAAWILRTFLVINKYSDVITQYWYGDDWYRLSDYNPNNIQRETFVTTGYVEGITQAKDRNRRPMTTYWYIVSFKADMKDYYFSHIVVEAGVQRTTQDIGITMHPELWVMAFRKIDGSSCLVAWLGCSDWKTHAAQIDVPETTVQVTDYVEHEVRQSLVGNVTSVPASNGKISLTITEYPLIIKTANIGVGKLETPVNLKIVNGVLSWDDFNAVGTVTEIYSSSLPDSGFTLIHSSVLSQGKYTLPLSNDQHYRVRFINDISFSDFSETVSK